jgi:DNA polymerase-3 subunit delta
MGAFDGTTADAEEILAAANTLPFMAERRLVVVRDADKLGREAAEAITEYCAAPAEHTALVLVARKLAKNTRLYKAVDRLDGVFEYKAPKRNELPALVGEMFEERGKTVDREGAVAVVDAVGTDLRALESEVDKIAAHAGDGARLGADDVAQVVSATAPTSVFDYLDALGARDASEALKLLARLIADGERVPGLHQLSVRHVRSLLSVRTLLDRDAPQAEIAATLGRPGWLVRRLAEQARRFHEDELVRALRSAAATEADMKTSRVDARLALEKWVAEVCAGV